MANLTRYNPFRDLDGVAASMFDLASQSLISPRWVGGSQPSAYAFPLNIREQEDALVVEAALPGVTEDQLQLKVENGLLTITAETQHEAEQQEGERWWLREQQFGRVQRSLWLPVEVNADQAEAELQNGILSIRLPKTEQSKPRRITVSSSSNRLISGSAKETESKS